MALHVPRLEHRGAPRPSTEHPRFSIRDVRVGELDGEIVTSLVMLPLQAWCAGTSATSIGAVAINRRSAAAAASAKRSSARRCAKYASDTMLYAFRSDFYQRVRLVADRRTNMISLPPSATHIRQREARCAERHCGGHRATSMPHGTLPRARASGGRAATDLGR